MGTRTGGEQRRKRGGGGCGGSGERARRMGNKGNFINMQHNVCAGSWEDLQKLHSPHLLLMS